MITVPCAACGELMTIQPDHVSYITPVGLIANLCNPDCCKAYSNADFDVEAMKKRVKQVEL